MLFTQTLVAFLLSATALAIPGDWQKDHEYEKSVCKTKTKYVYETYSTPVYKTTTSYKTETYPHYTTEKKYVTKVETYYETKPYYETKTKEYPATVTEYKPATTKKENYVTVCKTKWYGDHYDYSEDEKGWKA